MLPRSSNSYICCYVPSQNKMIPRHDCTSWNETEATALSNPEPNTSNLSDGVTTPEEEFNYDLLGPQPITDGWDPNEIQQSTIPDVSPPVECSRNHLNQGRADDDQLNQPKHSWSI